MRIAKHGEKDAVHAVTYYAVVETAAQKLAWLSLKPVTGRTHQLRAHMAHIGHPIVGDPKYFNKENWQLPGGMQDKLHLLARRIAVPHPRGGTIDVSAPLPPHMQQTWNLLGFDAQRYDPIEEAPGGVAGRGAGAYVVRMLRAPVIALLLLALAAPAFAIEPDADGTYNIMRPEPGTPAAKHRRGRKHAEPSETAEPKGYGVKEDTRRGSSNSVYPAPLPGPQAPAPVPRIERCSRCAAVPPPTRCQKPAVSCRICRPPVRARTAQKHSRTSPCAARIRPASTAPTPPAIRTPISATASTSK